MESIEQILSICSLIYKAAENVKANKERCQRVAQRVKALQDLVLTIKQRGPGQISATVENALRELCTSLEEAKTLMIKFSQTKGVKSFFKSSSHEELFQKVNEKLTDNFQVLSGALQIEHGAILSKVYETVSGRRQDEEYWSGQAPTSPTSPMPVSSPTSPMPVSSPTSPMPLPSTMPYMPVSSPTSPMPVSSPTSPMPLPSTMPYMPVSSPTSPMPLPSTMPYMPVSSPTSPMPLAGIMTPLQMSGPRTPVPLPGPMPPMQISSPTAPMPVPCIMSPMPMSTTTAMPLRGIMAPTRFLTTTASRPVLATVSPIVISSTIAPRPVHRIVAPVQAPFAPMTSSTQTTSVVRVANRSYYA